jgi:hypothetical protein
VSLSWLVTGRTVGGCALSRRNRVSREKALAMWTHENTWFSNEVGKKGQIKAGQLADLAVLSDDYFSVPEHRSSIRSVLTLLGGKVVHGEGRLCAARPGPAAPDARLVAGRDLRRLSQDARGARRGSPRPAAATPPAASMATIAAALGASVPAADVQTFWGALGCGCWAV